VIVLSEKPSPEQVYRQYIKPVRIVAYGILRNDADAEDVAHDVFLTYFQIKDPERIKNIKNYLLKMARNKALEYLRREGREELREELSAFSAPVAGDDENWEVTRVGEEIARLPLMERQIFLMHVNADLGFTEISKVVEMSVPAVYRRYRKALKLLQKALKGGERHE